MLWSAALGIFKHQLTVNRIALIGALTARFKPFSTYKWNQMKEGDLLYFESQEKNQQWKKIYDRWE